jgi:hypothetical protein
MKPSWCRWIRPGPRLAPWDEHVPRINKLQTIDGQFPSGVALRSGPKTVPILRFGEWP